MYSKLASRKANDRAYDQKPEQLSAGLVSSGTVIGSVNELPRVGPNDVDGFSPVGEPLKYNRLEGKVNPLGSLGLAGIRKALTDKFSENPGHFYGVTNQTDDVVFIQAFTRTF